MLKYIIPMVNHEDLLKNAELAIQARFQSIPNTKYLLKKADINTLGPDFVLKLKKANFSKTIFFEVKNNGQPREARISIGQLQNYIKENPSAYGVLVAPYISDQAAEICKESNVGILDFAGNCRLAFDDVFVEFKGASNPFNVRRELKTLYSPKSSRVLRVLLNQPNRCWKLKDLSLESQVSLGQVSNVKNLLEYREWISSPKQGIKLTQPKEVLAEWVNNYNYPRENYIERFYSLKNNDELMSVLSGCFLGMYMHGCKDRFALTGVSGANCIYPYVNSTTLSLYVENIDAWISQFDLKRVDSGENVFLVKPYDEGVFYGSQTLKNVPVVSNIQLYLDLMTSGGRGQDAAETLLNEVILKKWK